MNSLSSLIQRVNLFVKQRVNLFVDAQRPKLGRLVWRILWGRVKKSIDVTRRCTGCGYYDGELGAGDDHPGYNCVFVYIPWYKPIFEFMNRKNEVDFRERFTLYNAIKYWFRRRWIEFLFRGVDSYSRKPALPIGWEWNQHFDATPFPTDLASGPRAVWVSVSEHDESNGALTATIRIECSYGKERRAVIAGALHGIDVFCQRASIRSVSQMRAKTTRERWALAWANARARIKRWALIHL